MNEPSTQAGPPATVIPDNDWRELYGRRKTKAAEAVREIKSGHRVFIGSGCGEPQHLVQALEEAIPSLADLEILHILSVGKTRYTEAGFDNCRLKSFFVAAASREAVAEGRADYTPVNLADIPQLFRAGALPIDVALIQVSPPDEHGFCSYGVSVDIVKSAAESAKYIIAQVNSNMPRTLGDSFIHVRDIQAFVEHDEPLLEVGLPLINQVAIDIGKHVAGLVEDGSTIRVGVGSVSTAALYALEKKKDLGVHADMLTDAYLHLVKSGAITNARKTLNPGRIVTSFCLGSRELYDFVDNNPMVAFYPIEYTNNYLVISENEKMVSINSCLEVDLSGQVCSDSLGYEIYSGVGGAIDFFRGARGSKNGKAIMVLPSTTMDGQKSRIVPALTEGAGVVTTRGGVQYVVTEFGVAYLHGKSIRERALALISISHPDFRDRLLEAAHDLHYVERDSKRTAITRAIYPHDWEQAQIFDDNIRVFFRPVKPSDERALKEFFYSLPKKQSYVRFLSAMKVFPLYDFKGMVNIDYFREVSVIGLAGDAGSERIVAFARYTLDREDAAAEVDFAVHPYYAREGVGSFLLHHLAEKCRERGIKELVAYVSVGSEHTFGIFQKLGYVVRISRLGNTYEVRIFLNEPAQVCHL